MGCDIHLYVEYSEKDDPQNPRKSDRPKRWWSFGSMFNPGRHYTLFGLLSKGVRSDSDDGFGARGLPEDVGFRAEWESRLWVTEKGEGENETTLERAIGWKGCKKYRNNEDKIIAVDHPDWHSHSWLTTQELGKVLRKCPAGREYKAVLAAMRALENGGGQEARIVFWFDN